MSREERRKERQAVYNTKRWKELRLLKIQSNPLCEDCLKNGKITPSEEVHHIKSFCKKGLSPEEKELRAYDYGNLVSLCRECHWRRHHPEGIIQDLLDKYK